MRTVSSWKGAALVAHHWRNNSVSKNPWQLRWKPVCSSTESALNDWLKEKPLRGNYSRALFSNRQTFGYGQHGRRWHSPFGGVWVSAAIPKIINKNSACLLSLAVAVALAQRLENKGILVSIKWPNDLLVDEYKLSGIIGRLMSRGDIIRMARVGVGLNVFNKVPDGGISLVDILGEANLKIEFWSSEVLIAIENSLMFLEDTEWVIKQVEKRLWAREVFCKDTSQLLEIIGLDNDGGLLLSNGSNKEKWTRF